MKFINLRNVANKEINESYSGILRISPYIADNILYDDPTPLLTSENEEIKLSDSDGNFLNITFIPKKFATFVSGYTEKIDLINITQKTTDLYITNSLTIKPTLKLDNGQGTYPIQIINGSKLLTFPIEAPIDTRYINYNDKLGLGLTAHSSDESIQKAFSSLPASHEIYSDAYSDYHIKVNGKKLYRVNEVEGAENDVVPELYKHDYVLGQYPGHTHRINMSASELKDLTSNTRKGIDAVTKLSFVPIEKFAWSMLEGSTNGSYRSYTGRYRDLLPVGSDIESVGTENDLFKKLFVTDDSEEAVNDLIKEIKNNSPLVGLPIQSGLITYNAIPPRRYFFHLLRRYNDAALKKNAYMQVSITDDKGVKREVKDYISKAAKSNSIFMHNMTAEYALCDGKRVKSITKEGKFVTDYPALNTNSTEFKNWSGAEGNNPKNVYDAIASSIDVKNTYVNTLRTPALFDMRQLSPCFLRGLNWLRGVSYKKRETENSNKWIDDTWVYNHYSDVIEKDGRYAIGDWLDPHNSNIPMHPEVMMPEVQGSSENPLDNVKYEFFDNTIKHVLPGTKADDQCNIVKNISRIGRHYCNYDYKLNDSYRHFHQPLVEDDKLKNTDQLYKVRDYYQATSGSLESESHTRPTTGVSWDNYVKLNANTFLNSYVMRSKQGVSGISKAVLKRIKDLPIVTKGGTASTMRRVISSHKKARVRFSLGGDVCWGHKHYTVEFYQPDGGYRFVAHTSATASPNIKQGWRFLSSLPIANKYGSYKNAAEYATAVYENKIINIDDTLPSPPSINFLPLFKI